MELSAQPGILGGFLREVVLTSAYNTSLKKKRKCDKSSQQRV